MMFGQANIKLRSMVTPGADPRGRAIKACVCGLWPLACWDCGLYSRWGDGCLSVVNAVYCQIDVSATGRSPVQRSPIGCGVSECDREAGQRGGPDPLGAVAPWKNNYCPGKTVTINKPRAICRLFQTVK